MTKVVDPPASHVPEVVMQRSEEESRRSSERMNRRARMSDARTARTDSDGRLEPPVQLEEPLTTWLSLSWGIELG